MPLQDDADCSPILIDDSSAENVCKILMSGFQLYKSDENDLLVGNELSDAVLNAAQHRLKQCFTTINAWFPVTYSWTSVTVQIHTTKCSPNPTYRLVINFCVTFDCYSHSFRFR